MLAAPPHLNLVVIRSGDIDRAVTFYQMMGLVFEKHSHGSGPEHYASEVSGFVFEIYPLNEGQPPTTSTRIGFSVDDVDAIVSSLKNLGAKIVSPPKDSEWGRRAVVRDLDGHSVELITPLNRDIIAASDETSTGVVTRSHPDGMNAGNNERRSE